MTNDRNRSGRPESEEKGSSHFLLLCLIRTVVEKHGGYIEVNEVDNTFTISIPESQKAACLQELEEIMGPSKPISEVSVRAH